MTRAGVSEPRPDAGGKAPAAPAPAANPRDVRPGPLRPLIPLLSVAAVVVVLGLHFAWRNEPFDGTLGSQISAGYLGYSMRAFDALGFTELAMQWSLFFHPEAPDVRLPYVHHPALPLLLLRPGYLAFGRTEGALRLSVLALLAVAATALGLLAGRAGGAVAGGLALLFFVTAPVIVQHGNLLCPPLLGLPWMLLAAAAWLRVRETRSAPAVRAFVLAALAAALSDWNAYGLVPALLLDLWWWRGRRGGRLAAGALAVAPFVAGIVVILGWAAWTYGGVGPMVEAFARVPAALGPYGSTFAQWLAAVESYLGAGFGAPLLLLAGLGLVLLLLRSASGRRTALDRVAWILLVACAVPCAVFWSRTGTHDFWILLLAPAIAVLSALPVAWILEVAGRRRGRAAKILAAALGVALLALAAVQVAQGIQAHDRCRTTLLRDRAAVIDRVFAPEDVVLFPDYDATFGARFYARVPVAPMVENRTVFDQIMELLRPGRDRIGRLWFAVPQEVWERHAWSAGLPRVSGSERAISFGPTTLVYIELDKERCLP